jgi:hypothetical protein
MPKYAKIQDTIAILRRAISTQRVTSCFSSCEEISTTMGIIFSRSSD